MEEYAVQSNAVRAPVQKQIESSDERDVRRFASRRGKYARPLPTCAPENDFFPHDSIER